MLNDRLRRLLDSDAGVLALILACATAGVGLLVVIIN